MNEPVFKSVGIEMHKSTEATDQSHKENTPSPIVHLIDARLHGLKSPFEKARLLSEISRACPVLKKEYFRGTLQRDSSFRNNNHGISEPRCLEKKTLP
ncbi:hypothetical protein CEXT_27191 [Caerostris extrusa]|uniref:Uncharacterized protein n=1 Tax=Caerostris extrusa TaxID=172846 RepID=A0AAV4QSZ2_CAEEX|nr:hypothetical protein CEXT_27191 [Caerostris extrusa]